MKKLTYKELDRKYGKIANLATVCIFVIIFLLICLGVVTFATSYEERQIKQENQKLKEKYEPEIIEYKCPILFEIGNYSFENGALTSPSGKVLDCEVI